jgi:hypothetical protein
VGSAAAVAVSVQYVGISIPDTTCVQEEWKLAVAAVDIVVRCLCFAAMCYGVSTKVAAVAAEAMAAFAAAEVVVARL